MFLSTRVVSWALKYSVCVGSVRVNDITCLTLQLVTSCLPMLFLGGEMFHTKVWISNMTSYSCLCLAWGGNFECVDYDGERRQDASRGGQELNTPVIMVFRASRGDQVYYFVAAVPIKYSIIVRCISQLHEKYSSPAGTFAHSWAGQFCVNNMGFQLISTRIVGRVTVLCVAIGLYLGHRPWTNASFFIWGGGVGRRRAVVVADLLFYHQSWT